MAEPLYSVATYDCERSAYTPQRGLTVPSFNITLAQLRQAVRDLKSLGYSAHRLKHIDGCNDPDVLIERTDGECWREVMRRWKR